MTFGKTPVWRLDGIVCIGSTHIFPPLMPDHINIDLQFCLTVTCVWSRSWFFLCGIFIFSLCLCGFCVLWQWLKTYRACDTIKWSVGSWSPKKMGWFGWPSEAWNSNIIQYFIASGWVTSLTQTEISTNYLMDCLTILTLVVFRSSYWLWRSLWGSHFVSYWIHCHEMWCRYSYSIQDEVIPFMSLKFSSTLLTKLN